MLQVFLDIVESVNLLMSQKGVDTTFFRVTVDILRCELKHSS